MTTSWGLNNLLETTVPSAGPPARSSCRPRLQSFPTDSLTPSCHEPAFYFSILVLASLLLISRHLFLSHSLSLSFRSPVHSLLSLLFCFFAPFMSFRVKSCYVMSGLFFFLFFSVFCSCLLPSSQSKGKPFFFPF